MIEYFIEPNGEYNFYPEYVKRRTVPAPGLEERNRLYAEIEAEFNLQRYKLDRQYPSIGDQLDMIFHAGLGGDEFQAAIQAVKDAYPKPVPPEE